MTPGGTSTLLRGVEPAGGVPRLLFVHAHPDDETLATGVAVAHHAAAGHDVHVLTCTRGEEGEVIPPGLAHLQGRGEDLARHRLGELEAAVAALGATSHLLAPAAGDTPYRDSGMAGSSAAAHPRAWAGVPVDEATEAVRRVIERLRPDVVVTYDASGGYGHPDHVRVHEATRRAVASLARPPALLGALTPRSWAVEDRAWLAAHVGDGGWVVPGATDPFQPCVVPDEVVTRHVVDRSVLPAQRAAMAAHATQVVVGDGWWALSNRVVARSTGREGYARLDPADGSPLPEDLP